MGNQRISDSEYKKILENMPVCCVDLIINHNKKVLLIKRKNKPVKGQWWVPGGRVYKNEKLGEAVIRKAKEELGIEVKIERELGIYETFFDKGPFPNLKTGVHTLNITFIVKPLENQEIKLDRASSEYKWIDKIEENHHPYIKQVLKESGVFN